MPHQDRPGFNAFVFTNNIGFGLSGTRLEGQFIWADAQHIVTFTLHFLDLSGRCELIGTAEVVAQ